MNTYNIMLYMLYSMYSSAYSTVISKYKCHNNEHCLKIYNHGYAIDHSNFYSDLNHCRLLCGKYGSLWPLPTGIVNLYKHTVMVNPLNIGFEENNHNLTNEGITIFKEIKKYFMQNLHGECRNTCVNSGDGHVIIKTFITSAVTHLHWSTDESYKLNISDEKSGIQGVTIEAQTVFGFRHACETLLQLFVVVPDYSNTTNSSLHIVSRAFIVDRPIFQHRGLLLDTARNFISITSLKKQLDAMAASKMNVFHWHVSDTQSFPLVLEHVPEMLSDGIYSAKAVYTPKDVKKIIKYAKHRGIRVILELDAPAHAGNGWQWGPGKGLGDLGLCINQQPWRTFCIEPPCGQLNPVNPNLYIVLQQIYNDIASLNEGESVFHMGGDEVFFGCWNASQEIVKYMLDRGMGLSEMDFLVLWSEFQDKALGLWDNARLSVNRNRTDSDMVDAEYTQNQFVILWSSSLTDPAVINNFLSRDRYVIQTWLPKTSEIPLELQKLGYKLIISTKDAWYLDHGFWGQTQYYNWKKVYDNRLMNGKGILGGEVCVWTEFIDVHSLDGRTWPRAAAAAERLWSNPRTNAAKAESRFFRHRKRLISRGLQPDAVAPKWCEENEGECH